MPHYLILFPLAAVALVLLILCALDFHREGVARVRKDDARLHRGHDCNHECFK